MPSLNFQKQFVPLIESGQKRQTIRPVRKNPIKVGDKLYLFTGLRTKNCGRICVDPLNLGERTFQELNHVVICKSIEKIRLNNGVVWLGEVDFGKEIDYKNHCITDLDLYQFAKADGFSNADEMFTFFKKQYGLPFEGVLIKW